MEREEEDIRRIIEDAMQVVNNKHIKINEETCNTTKDNNNKVLANSTHNNNNSNNNSNNKDRKSVV